MSRMWMLSTHSLCRQHLLGEHKELHQLVGTINAGRLSVIEGHARLKQVDTRLIRSRHEQLVQEMLWRGHNHNSPLPEFDDPELGEVDPTANLVDLCSRCPECKRRLEQ